MNERAQRQGGSGRFITLEGPDGAGKSIHAERLGASLRARGLTVTLVRETGGTGLRGGGPRGPPPPASPGAAGGGGGGGGGRRGGAPPAPRAAGPPPRHDRAFHDRVRA